MVNLRKHRHRARKQRLNARPQLAVAAGHGRSAVHVILQLLRVPIAVAHALHVALLDAVAADVAAAVAEGGGGIVVISATAPHLCIVQNAAAPQCMTWRNARDSGHVPKRAWGCRSAAPARIS